MTRRRLYFGLLSIILSFASFIPNFAVTLPAKFFLAVLFAYGFVIICEWTTMRLAHKSLMREIERSAHNLLAFLFTTTIAALFIEGVGLVLGKLWIFPYHSPSTYLIAFIPTFAVYWLTVCESYLAAKTLIDYAIRGRRRITKMHPYEPGMYKIFGILGALFTILSLALMISDFSKQPLPLFTPQNLYSMSPAYQAAFSEILLLLLGLWLLLEWVEYHRKKTSLIKDIVHHYYTPIIAIIFGASVNALLMESQNLPSDIWVYTNWPLSSITFLGLPLTMFMMWILHYIPFLSLFRAVTDKESSAIWQADDIK